MIHYHGGPVAPETAAAKLYRGRHAFVSYAEPRDIGIAASLCQSFALDNGAFSLWRAGKATDWPGYYAWCREWLAHPGCDWAVIPDVIDGDEAANDALIAEWPFGQRGVPVWHMHETISRLARLCQAWPRVALGSSGEFATVGDGKWWARMNKALNAVCVNGRPKAKLHGLRMLDPDVFSRMPLSSADSTNVARNIGMDGAWRGTYTPASKETRALVLAERVEQVNAADRWHCGGVQLQITEGGTMVRFPECRSVSTSSAPRGDPRARIKAMSDEQKPHALGVGFNALLGEEK